MVFVKDAYMALVKDNPLLVNVVITVDVSIIHRLIRTDCTVLPIFPIESLGTKY